MEEKRACSTFSSSLSLFQSYLSLFNIAMDSIDFDYVKAEKAKALLRFNRFRRFGRFFRAAELFVALLFICWTFTLLPFAVQISGAFLRRIAGVISTPLFVFLLGNSIVAVLLTKSSDHKTGVSAASTETEIYQAFVRSVENRSKPSDEDITDEIVYDDKQVIVTDLNSNSNKIADEIDSDSSSDTVTDQPKVYRRSKSEVSAKQMVIKRSLQRSETEKCREIEKKIKKVKEEEDKKKKKKKNTEDKLSNEEFQKTIEAFIAKQLMFRRQESLAVVVHNNA